MNNVSIYNGVKDRKGIIVPIQAVIDRIITGAKGLDETTRLLNVLAQTEPKKYKKEKEN